MSRMRLAASCIDHDPTMRWPAGPDPYAIREPRPLHESSIWPPVPLATRTFFARAHVWKCATLLARTPLPPARIHQSRINLAESAIQSCALRSAIGRKMPGLSPNLSRK
jgi:hypothetical protein